MLRFMAGGTDEYRLYDPRIFVILREWLAAMEADPDRDPETILAEADRIHARLEEYLRLSRFAADWTVIRKNCRDPGHLRRQFHVWFDGLKTLKTGSPSEPFRLSIGSHVRRPEGTYRSYGIGRFHE